MFPGAENAYASLDFSGKGHVTFEEIMDSYIVKNKIKQFSEHQIAEFLKSSGIFMVGQTGINFDAFKKTFYPHLYNTAQEIDDEFDVEAAHMRKELMNSKKIQGEIIERRLDKIEEKLKKKFSNCFHSVRKAFLSLDTDHDGFITVEDILKYFGMDKDLNPSDLKKLMLDKDEQHTGKINFTDFSKWLGSAIHMSEGFYFRHDSVQNPYYEM